MSGNSEETKLNFGENRIESLWTHIHNVVSKYNINRMFGNKNRKQEMSLHKRKEQLHYKAHYFSLHNYFRFLFNVVTSLH